MHEKKFNDSKSNNKNVPILDLSKSKHNKLEINKSNQLMKTTCYLTKIHILKKLKEIITLIKFINL